MAEKRFVVRLSDDERTELRAVVKAKRMAAQKRVRAQVLLKVDEGDAGPAWTDARAAEAFDVHENTVAAIRRRLVEGGLAAAVERPPRPRRPRTLTPAVERELLAVAQGPPPAGRVRWTLHLLADRLVELDVVDSVSHETVRQGLKKTTSRHTARSAG
jgi:transposase